MASWLRSPSSLLAAGIAVVDVVIIIIIMDIVAVMFSSSLVSSTTRLNGFHQVGAGQPRNLLAPRYSPATWPAAHTIYLVAVVLSARRGIDEALQES